MLDILQDTTEHDSTHSLELDRFKDKIREIWSRMLKETYDKYYDIEDEDSVSEEHFMECNALKFADEPEPVDEIDELMQMLDSLMEEDDEQEDIKSESKAPNYTGEQLKEHNEKGKVETTTYEVKHKATGKVKEESKTVKGGTYDTPSDGPIKVRKDAQVIRKYAPLLEEVKEKLRSLEDRQRIGRRKQFFRL